MSKKVAILSALALMLPGPLACQTFPSLTSSGSAGFKDGAYEGMVDQTGSTTYDGVSTPVDTHTSAGDVFVRFANGQLNFFGTPDFGAIDATLTTAGQTGAFTLGSQVTNWTLVSLQASSGALQLVVDYTTSSSDSQSSSTGSGRVTATFTLVSGYTLIAQASVAITYAQTEYNANHQVTHTSSKNVQHAGTLTWAPQLW